jgi:hypothetical protein
VGFNAGDTQQRQASAELPQLFPAKNTFCFGGEREQDLSRFAICFQWHSAPVLLFGATEMM